jgi:hypothetical protein
VARIPRTALTDLTKVMMMMMMMMMIIDYMMIMMIMMMMMMVMVMVMVMAMRANDYDDNYNEDDHVDENNCPTPSHVCAIIARHHQGYAVSQ